MNKYALVTGGAGFVGSALSLRLIAEGYQVTICDDLSNGKRENIPIEAEFHKLDISDSKCINKSSLLVCPESNPKKSVNLGE